eukprot:6667697-Pyramimonas_sp.AAC.1
MCIRDRVGLVRDLGQHIPVGPRDKGAVHGPDDRAQIGKQVQAEVAQVLVGVGIRPDQQGARSRTQR